MYHSRGSRGMRRQSIRPVVKSFKKIINSAQATFAAGFQSEFLVQGENIAADQSTPTDPAVPTGSIIKYIEIQFAAANILEAPLFINCTIQYTLSSQVGRDPDTLGGNNQRNQCLHMDLFSVGGFQNSTHKFRFKVPKKFQRVREGMDWLLVWSNSASVVRKVQTIYQRFGGDPNGS